MLLHLRDELVSLDHLKSMPYCTEFEFDGGGSEFEFYELIAPDSNSTCICRLVRQNHREIAATLRDSDAISVMYPAARATTQTRIKLVLPWCEMVCCLCMYTTHTQIKSIDWSCLGWWGGNNTHKYAAGEGGWDGLFCMHTMSVLPQGGTCWAYTSDLAAIIVIEETHDPRARSRGLSCVHTMSVLSREGMVCVCIYVTTHK